MEWEAQRFDDNHAKSRTPYVDWYIEVEKRLRPDGTSGFRNVQDLFLLPDAAAKRLFGVSGFKDLVEKLLAEGYGDGVEIPLPEFALPEPFVPPPLQDDWLPDPELFAEYFDDLPSGDDVIVGIVDEGIALGHNRFRKSDGKTRFLHNWQQGGVWRDPPHPFALPFGRDMFQKEINDNLQAESWPASYSGELDEEAFNRSLGITDFMHATASRAVDRSAAHGTHVLDLAAGSSGAFDEIDPDRTRILSVTLPPRPVVGLAGTFLAFFAIQGMLRMIDLADLISLKVKGRRGGFPVVINMSYGQQAGPKDGQALFERFVKALNEYRENQSYLPVRLVMPAGNDNLQRCRARWNIKAKDKLPLPWRILPEDQSANFVEIWTDGVHKSMTQSPVSIDITMPNGSKVKNLNVGKPGFFDEIIDADGHVHGRIYTRRVQMPGRSHLYRFNHVICVAPTLFHDAVGWKAAPAGIWLLEIQNDLSKGKLETYIHVQVDQAARPDEDTSGRSYFDNPKYRTHEKDGRLRDTYRYPLTGRKSDNRERANKVGAVQRKGTHNSIATFDEILVIGGYRESDGRPAPYSSSTQGDRSVPPGRKLLTCAMPSETAPHYWGQLGAGTRSGSAVALSGTSFATAHMTRLILDELLAGGDPDLVGSNKWAEDAAKRADGRNEAHPLKVGAGRLPSKKSPLDRLGR